MTNLTKYGPMLAKISVLNRSLLSNGDYGELINKKTVPEVASFLKNQAGYSSAFSDCNESLMHREELEERLDDAFAIDFEKIYNMEDNDNKKFLSYVVVRSEVETLKNILRRIENGRRNINVHIPEVYRRRYSVDVDKISTSENVREFLVNLSGSRYEMQIKPHLTMEEHQNIFSVGFALDMYYYTYLRGLADTLSNKTDKKVILNAVGAEIDALNLLWIYRLKKYFDMDKELIFTYLIPNNYKLKNEKIIELVQTKTVNEFVSFAKRTPYGALFVGDDGDYLEYGYKRYIYHLYKKLQRENPFTLMTAVSYLHIREQEIKNITSVTEGIRYGLLPEKIRRYVISLNADAN